jgi:hypothetical protein
LISKLSKFLQKAQIRHGQNSTLLIKVFPEDITGQVNTQHQQVVPKFLDVMRPPSAKGKLAHAVAHLPPQQQ